MGIYNKVKQVYHEINENVYQISRKTDKNRFLLIMDMLVCLLKYSASPNNYAKFEFYYLNSTQRKSYVTYGLSQKMIRTFNNTDDINIFENKLRFAREFQDMFKRDYLDTTNMSYEAFGVTFAIETEIANGSQPSIIAPVNLENGVMEKPAVTFGSKLYMNHPKTSVQIQGVQLPFWNEVKDMLRTACKRVPTVGYIGWDLAITPNGPLIIEGNTTPGYKYYQIPKHLEKGIANRKICEKHLK